MPKFICYYDGWYFDWSTVVDAPVSFGMREHEYAEHYPHPLGELPARMMRAQRYGTSARSPQSIKELIEGNRAGFEETYLTLAEIIQIYCVEQREPRKGEGVDLPADE